MNSFHVFTFLTFTFLCTCPALASGTDDINKLEFENTATHFDCDQVIPGRREWLNTIEKESTSKSNVQALHSTLFDGKVPEEYATCNTNIENVCGLYDNGIRCIKAPCPATWYIDYKTSCDACRDIKVYGFFDRRCTEEEKQAGHSNNLRIKNEGKIDN